MTFTIRKSPPEEKLPGEDQWFDFDDSINSLNAGWGVSFLEKEFRI